MRFHEDLACAGEFCVIHNPSKHHMNDWPIIVRLDRDPVLTERRCPHGIGHPDPDSLAWIVRMLGPEEGHWRGVHGCDGCCHASH